MNDDNKENILIRAETILLLPINFLDNEDRNAQIKINEFGPMNPTYWERKLLERKLINKLGNGFLSIWETIENEDSIFKDQYQITDTEIENSEKNVWYTKKLKISKNVLNKLFKNSHILFGDEDLQIVKINMDS